MAILLSATHNELVAIWKLAINELKSDLDKFPTETIPRTRISHTPGEERFSIIEIKLNFQTK